MKLLPHWLVDRLPIAWCRPGNLHTTRIGDLHFCAGDWVGTFVECLPQEAICMAIRNHDSLWPGEAHKASGQIEAPA